MIRVLLLLLLLLLLLMVVVMEMVVEASVLDEVVVRDVEVERWMTTMLEMEEEKRTGTRKLARNVIVMDGLLLSPGVVQALSKLAFRVPLVMEHELYKKVFPKAGQVTCLFKGTPMDFVLDWNEQSPGVEEGLLSGEQILPWVNEKCQKMEIGWISYIEGDPLDMYWVDPQSKEKYHIGTISAGEKNTQWRNTYLGHHFRIEDKGNLRMKPIDYVVEYDSVNILGKPSAERGSDVVRPPSRYHEKTMSFEKDRASRVKVSFTEVGFKKMNTPRRLWGSILMYYNNNAQSGYLEDFGAGNFVVNWHETYPKLVVPPWGRKGMWQDIFKPVLEEWSGVALEKTDIYGIRTYYDGATLASHVDRQDTHAVSAIINVDQVGMREDWMLEIYDLFGNVHNIPMKPGEAVLYESAKCIHGRPQPLQGANYTNIFVHYRPVGQPKWWTGDVEILPYVKGTTSEDL